MQTDTPRIRGMKRGHPKIWALDYEIVGRTLAGEGVP